MKIIIDIKAKQVGFEGSTNISEFVTQLKQFIPEDQWNDWKIDAEPRIEHYSYPIYPSVPQPDPYNPWNPTITWTTGTETLPYIDNQWQDYL